MTTVGTVTFGAITLGAASYAASHAGTAVSVTIFDFPPSVSVMNSGIANMKSVIFVQPVCTRISWSGSASFAITNGSPNGSPASRARKYASRFCSSVSVGYSFGARILIAAA